MKKEIRIGIAEDHPFTRLGLLSVLKPHKNINVLFDVSNGKELLDKLKTEKPDILLLDVEMPVMRAQEVLEKIQSRYPKIKVIIISAFFLENYIIECFKLGAKAFLPKGDSIEKTLEVIDTVFEKGIYTDTEVAKILAQEIKNPKKDAANLKLKAKELEIIRLICSGLSRIQAAEKQEMSVDGLNYHMRKIMNKTGTETKKDLIMFAIQNKLFHSNS